MAHTVPGGLLPHLRKLFLRLSLPAGMHETETVPSLALDALYSRLLVTHEYSGLLCAI